MTISLILFDLGDTLIEQRIDDKYPLDHMDLVAYPDSASTLSTLFNHYRMGILSDTTQSDCAAVSRSLETLNLRHYFDEIITSVDVGCCKPDARMFNTALERFGVGPEQTVMIGNDYESDIVGADKCGLLTIWICRPPLQTNPEQSIANRIVSDLNQVPRAIASLD